MPQEQAQPIVDDTSSGDFGAGVGSLEEQLLDSLPKEGEEPQGKEINAGEAGDVSDNTASAKTDEGGTPSSTPAEPVPMFDVDGKVTLKEGDKLSADHIREIERRGLREADYTRKTQEVSAIRKEAEDILQTRDAILQDPKVLRQVFEDKHIVSAFTRPEMLNIGLASAGVDPETWNKFLGWMKDNDELPRGSQVPRADPFLEKMTAFERRMESLERNLTEGEKARLRQEEEKQQEAETQNFRTEVDAAVGKFKGITKRELLVAVAASDDSHTVEQVAKALYDEKEGRYNEWVKNKTSQRDAAPKPAKGAPVPVMRKAPETLEEAKDMVAKLYGEGGLRGQEPFE